jgi:hypothetical protein
MTSSQSIVVIAVFGVGLVFLPIAWAAPVSEACPAAAGGRATLYLMINAKDKSAQDAPNANVQAASAAHQGQARRREGACGEAPLCLDGNDLVRKIMRSP